jgi:protein-tyrosine-phosphatase
MSDFEVAHSAVETMARLGIDIKTHKCTPIDGIDLSSFDFVVALDKAVRQSLIKDYNVERSKLVDVFVADPRGEEAEQFLRCADAITKKLRRQFGTTRRPP